MQLLLVILLLLLVIGALPTWPYSAQWGYYPSGGLGTILVVVLLLLLTVGVIVSTLIQYRRGARESKSREAVVGAT